MSKSDTTSVPYRVLGDQPYTAESDPFHFADLARELRSLILESRPSMPFAIGIEASWGRGKSSLMAHLERQLLQVRREQDGVDVSCVSYNAWTAEGDDSMAPPFW